jgi:hypothetical protein
VPRKDGTTRRQHLMQAARQSGRIPEELKEPARDPATDWVWSVYWQVRGGERLTYGELESYCRLTATELDPWEVEAIMAMDETLEACIRREMSGGE